MDLEAWANRSEAGPPGFDSRASFNLFGRREKDRHSLLQ